MLEVEKTRAVTKKKTNQVPYGIVAIAAAVLVGIYLNSLSPRLPVSWMFGLAFGFVLQRSRFCFTASLRDPVLTRSTSLTKAVIIAFMVATVGFAAIQYNSILSSNKLVGHVTAVGLHTVIGAIMFGIGMVIAGGCASGTLMRVGEGFVMQWLSLAFFIIGSTWGAHDFGWWKATFMDASPKIHLPISFFCL